jgi:HK97 family phage major capsid protein
MTVSISDELMERRTKIITEAQEIARKGVSEGRDLSVEEQTAFDQRIAEADALAKRASDIAEGEKRARDLEESFRSATGRGQGEEQRHEEGSLAKWARESRNGDYFELAPVLGAERRALAAVRAGESRAMSATAGLGKDGVYGQLWEYAVQSSQILMAGADVLNTSDGNTLPLPVVTAHATGASAAANAALTASDAGLTTVDLSVTKDAYITLVPSELLQDSTFDLEGYLARAAGRELGIRINNRAEAAAIAGFTTSGANPASGSVGAATGAVFSDALIDLFHSVNPVYRTTSAWVMADPIAGAVRKTKDGSGQYVWERSLVPGNPLTIDNKPIYIGTTFDSTIAATKKIVYFGDWAALKVRIAGGLRFERSNDYAFGNDQVAFRAIVRSGAVVVDPNAVKYLVLV